MTLNNWNKDIISYALSFILVEVFYIYIYIIYTYSYTFTKERLKQIHVKVDEKVSGIDVWIESWVCNSVAYLCKSVAHSLYKSVAHQNMCHSVAQRCGKN